MTWFNKTVIDRIVKALENPNQYFRPQISSLPTPSLLFQELKRTGPVKTFADFVDHVPTSWVLMAVAEERRYAPAINNEFEENEGILCCVNECGDG